MAEAGKILVTASKRMEAGSRCARPAARAMRSRTAANLSPRFSIAVGSPQYNLRPEPRAPASGFVYVSEHLKPRTKQADPVVLERNPATRIAHMTPNQAGFTKDSAGYSPPKLLDSIRGSAAFPLTGEKYLKINRIVTKLLYTRKIACRAVFAYRSTRVLSCTDIFREVFSMKVKCFAALLLFVSAPLFAQSGGVAGISGVVKGPSGAVVPNAKVLMSTTSQGELRTLETNGAGIFAAPSLSPGAGYKIAVTAPGFAPYEATVDLQVGQNLN